MQKFFFVVDSVTLGRFLTGSWFLKRLEASGSHLAFILRHEQFINQHLKLVFEIHTADVVYCFTQFSYLYNIKSVLLSVFFKKYKF